jgi:hypothetical protein
MLGTVPDASQKGKGLTELNGGRIIDKESFT